MIVLDCPNPACARRHEVSDFLARLTIVCTSCQARIFVDPAKVSYEVAKPVPRETSQPKPAPPSMELKASPVPIHAARTSNAPPDRPKVRHRWSWIAGGAVAAIALIGGCALLINEMWQPEVAPPQKKIEIAVVPKVEPKADVEPKKTPENPAPVPSEVKEPEPAKEPEPKEEPKTPVTPKSSLGLGGPNPFEALPAKKPPRAERLARNSTAITKAIIKAWDTALEDWTGDGFQDVRDGQLFLIDFERLFDANGIRMAESALLLDRMEVVPDAEVEAFQKAVKIQIPRLDEEQTALVILIQQDALFKGNKFEAALSKLFRDRLQGLPAAVVETAAKVDILGVDSAMDMSAAATALASYDPLWLDNEFQEKVWQAMLKKHLAKSN